MTTRTTIAGITAACLLLLSSCIQPQQRYYQSPYTAEQRSANRAAMNAAEDESFAWRHRERMSNAQAAELATRHAPRSVTNQSTNVIVW